MTDTTTIADTTQEVTEATQQAVKQDWKCWRHWLLSLSEDW